MTTITLNGDTFTAIALKDTKPGDFIMRKPSAKTVFTRGHYDKSSKTYSIQDNEDWNRELFLKGSTTVYIGFDY
mgnify:FL=1|tara:strand:- start:142 stop:363 length:222 start_codon:yes stop_codon:yes gene_type:complete